MKKLNYNKNKFKKIAKKGITLIALTTTLTILPGCTKIPENWPEGFEYIDQENNSFDDYHKTIIKDGTPVEVYKGENISLAIDKKTFEAKKYIYDMGLVSEIYDFDTGYRLVSIVLLSVDGKENSEKIIENNYVVDFTNISDYVESETLKEYYTIEEIEELEPKIIESIKLMEKGSQKIK